MGSRLIRIRPLYSLHLKVLGSDILCVTMSFSDFVRIKFLGMYLTTFIVLSSRAHMAIPEIRVEIEVCLKDDRPTKYFM